MTRQDLADALRRSGLFDAKWYTNRYPDVARSGIEPALHYATLGAVLGRDPGPRVSAASYLDAHPDVAHAGIPALPHYLASGRAEGRRPWPTAAPPAKRPGRAELAHQRRLLETGGLEDGPLDRIAALARTHNDPDLAREAALVCALWALRAGDGPGALQWITAMDPAPAALHLVAISLAEGPEAALRLYDTATRDPDLHLAATRAMPDAATRVACLSRLAALDELGPLHLDDSAEGGGADPAFDRLRGPDLPPEGTGPDAPCVSVLMAAHDAEATLRPAIASVLGQSWRTLELLVIDDASRDATPDIAAEAAARDPRVRLLRLPRNSGAYAARNAGLAAARGAYVTLHDADDWAHPARLARQLAALRAAPWTLGNLSLQARLTPDLALSRWTGSGAMMFENLSSLLLPRSAMTEMLGGWDRVRVSADSELLRRARRLCGAASVPLVGAAPLAFQRDGGGNATADPATGMGWFYYGARQEYHAAQRHHHARAHSLRYDPQNPRPFPAPAILLPGHSGALRLNRVYAGRLMLPGPALETLLGWLDADQAAGRSVGLVPLVDAELPRGTPLDLHPQLRARIDGTACRVMVYGERAVCDDFRLLPGTPPIARQRYLPEVADRQARRLPPD